MEWLNWLLFSSVVSFLVSYANSIWKWWLSEYLSYSWWRAEHFWTTSYVIIYKSYTLLNMARFFFWPTLHLVNATAPIKLNKLCPLVCIINNNTEVLAILPAYQKNQIHHTSWHSCFTAGKFSRLTWADQSPLPHSVVQGPSVSLVSGTISMQFSVQESSVTSAGRLVELVCSLRTESLDILNYYNTTFNSCNTKTTFTE